MTGSWVGGIVIGLISGALLAFVHAIFTITLRADQIVTGTAINFLALGVTGYFCTTSTTATTARRKTCPPFRTST